MIKIKESINSNVSQIIEKIDTTSIFTNKCHTFRRIFEEIQKINKIFLRKKKNSQSLKRFNFNLFEFNTLLDDLNKQNLDDSFFKKYPSIQIILKKIDESVQLIFDDITSLYTLIFAIPSCDLFEDIKQYDILTKTQNFQSPELQKEIKNLYEQSKGPYITLMEQFQKKKFKDEGYDKILSPITTDTKKNAPYEIFQLENQNKEKVTITLLNDRSKFKTIFPILATINHPYLEKYIGTSITDSAIELITQIEGQPLKNVFPSSKFSPTIFAFKIAQSMSYLHSQKIVYCDLNPSNIYIDQIDSQNPQKVTPIISNFVNSVRLTKNSILGMPNITPTSPFCAPELTHNYQYDEKVDIFAFGGILFHLLTQSTPYEGKDSSYIRQQILDGNRPDIPEKFRENELLVKLITNCWCQNPIERASFDQIIDLMANPSNPIIFPSDEERRNEIISFYSENSIKNNEVKNCLSLFEQLINGCNNVYQFKFTFASIRMKLIDYKSAMKEKFALKEELDEKELNNLNTLRQALNFLLERMLIVQDFDHLFQFYSEHPDEFNQIKDNIISSMTQIHKITSNEEKVEDYQIEEDDLDIDCEELKDFFSNNVFQSVKCPFINKQFSNNPLIGKIDDIVAQFELKKVEESDFYYENTKIAEGATADVYKGIQIKTGLRVAIKILHEGFFDNVKNVIYLRREIGYLTRLKSVSSKCEKYMPAFIGFCFTKSHDFWLVSEFEESCLFDVISHLTIFEKTKIAFEIAEAIEYLHSQRIFHRDLKTTNIMLNENNTPVLIDFGFSQSDIKSMKFTRSIGTYNYMAPEVYDYKVKYGRGVDIYSYALILWELYSNECPFRCFQKIEYIFKLIELDLDKFQIEIEKGAKNLFSTNSNADVIIHSIMKNVRSFIDSILSSVEKNLKKSFDRISNYFFTKVKEINDGAITAAKGEDQIKSEIKNYLMFNNFARDIAHLFDTSLSIKIKNDLKENNFEIPVDFDNFITSKLPTREKVLNLIETNFSKIFTTNINTEGLIRELVPNDVRPLFEKPISSDLKKLIEKCWEGDPKKRPNITEVIDRMIDKCISYLPDDSNDEQIKNEITKFYEEKRSRRK